MGDGDEIFMVCHDVMPTDLRKQNEEAERLARRNERGRQQRHEETAEERETRLAKCREAWKKKTAEAKGKQKEYPGLQATEKSCRAKKHRGDC